MVFTRIDYNNFFKFIKWDQPRLCLCTTRQSLIIMNNIWTVADYREYFDLFETRIEDGSYAYVYSLSPFCGSALDHKRFKIWLYFFEFIVKIEYIPPRRRVRYLIDGLRGMAFSRTRKLMFGKNIPRGPRLNYSKTYEQIIEFLESQFYY